MSTTALILLVFGVAIVVPALLFLVLEGHARLAERTQKRQKRRLRLLWVLAVFYLLVAALWIIFEGVGWMSLAWVAAAVFFAFGVRRERRNVRDGANDLSPPD